MSLSNGLPKSTKPMPDVADRQDQARALDTPEMIDRLATEMRARSGGELPHAFYVEQVKRQLSGKAVRVSAANDEASQEKPAEHPSVFHAWALSE